MTALVRVDASRELHDLARSVRGELLALTGLRLAWLLSFPLAFYWLGDAALGLGAIAFGYCLNGVGQLLGQRLRRAVRARSLRRSAKAALDKAAPIPEANVDSSFWSSQLTETAVIVDLPALGAAAAALLTIAVLSWQRVGQSLVLTLGVLLVVALSLMTLSNRSRVRLLDRSVGERLSTAEVVSAAERDTGEISGPTAQERYCERVTCAADAWCRAQDRVERARFFHHAFIGALACGAVIWLAARHGLDVFAPKRAVSLTWRSASDVLLLGSGLPIARLLASHFDALLMGHAALAKLERPRVRSRRGRERLERPPRRLVISRLKHQYGEKLALELANCDLDLSQPLLVRGENGAGKTTLMAILAGALEYREGSVRLDGVEARDISAEDIAFVPQQPLALLELSIAENAALIAPDGSEPALRSLLDELGLERPTSHPMRALSRGEQQRVAIARALLKRPKLLVLDEPDAWLDREGRERLVALLARPRDGMAIVVVSHREEFRRLGGFTLELTRADGPRAQPDAPSPVSACGNKSA
jgi:ABC-type transport system involved in cytochrome bd biosynthesis fused ATPase/permease subunit